MKNFMHLALEEIYECIQRKAGTSKGDGDQDKASDDHQFKVERFAPRVGILRSRRQATAGVPEKGIA